MIGLLWQRDRADEPLETTIRNAAARYAERFGDWPTVALVAPDVAEESVAVAVGRTTHTIELRPSQRIVAGQVLVAIEGRDPTRPALPNGAVAEPAPPVQAEAATEAHEEEEEDEALDVPPSPPPREVAAPTLPPPAAEPSPAPLRIKRRSTMLWDPAREEQPTLDDEGSTAQQLSLWE